MNDSLTINRTNALLAAGIGIGVVVATLGYTFLFRDMLAGGVGFSSERMGFYSKSANACVPDSQKNGDPDVYFVSCGGIN